MAVLEGTQVTTGAGACSRLARTCHPAVVDGGPFGARGGFLAMGNPCRR